KRHTSSIHVKSSFIPPSPANHICSNLLLSSKRPRAGVPFAFVVVSWPFCVENATTGVELALVAFNSSAFLAFFVLLFGNGLGDRFWIQNGYLLGVLRGF